MPETLEWTAWLLMGLALLYAATHYGALRLDVPLLRITSRWLRWGVFALGFAWIMRDMGWLPQPLPVLCIVGALLWFLVETVYNWMVITAISRSQVPLFPRYKVNNTGDEWPSETPFIRLREWIRSNGFHKRQSLRADIADGYGLRTSVYDHDDGTLRLQVIFIMARTRSVTASLVFTTIGKDGQRISTDNVNLPFGGFYPEHWFIHRHPLVRSADKLLARHQGHVENLLASEPASFADAEPLEELNHQQEQLTRANREQGFLNPPIVAEEQGRISGEGRYRLWKEVWLLNYLGRTVA